MLFYLRYGKKWNRCSKCNLHNLSTLSFEYNSKKIDHRATINHDKMECASRALLCLCSHEFCCARCANDEL